MSQLPGLAEPYPSRDKIVKPDRKATDILVRYEEQSLLQRVSQTPYRVQTFDALTGIVASTSGTLGGDQYAGIYRVSVYREVTTADPVSSSLEGVISWTHNGKPLSRNLSAFNGAPQTVNDTAGDTFVIEVDPGTPISYALTYASNTPGLAQFYATLGAELLQPAE